MKNEKFFFSFLKTFFDSDGNTRAFFPYNLHHIFVSWPFFLKFCPRGHLRHHLPTSRGQSWTFDQPPTYLTSHRGIGPLKHFILMQSFAGLKWTWDAVFPGWTWIFSRFETTSFKTAKSHQVHTWSFSRFKSGFVNLPFFQGQIQFQIVQNLDLKRHLHNF